MKNSTTATTNHNYTRIISKQKQQQLQRRNHLFKVVGFILYSLGLVSLVLILLMAQRLESGRHHSFRVLLNFVRGHLDDAYFYLVLTSHHGWRDETNTVSQYLCLVQFMTLFLHVASKSTKHH